MPFLTVLIQKISVWLIPLVLAITLHEAAHGFVAHLLGDDTALRGGRVSFNPLRHVDLFGTILLPGILLLAGSPFLFGYAKPVPVDFRALRNPRLDSVLVAAAGPGMNFVLAALAGLAFHLVGLAPPTAALWLAANLRNALTINVVLALFNLAPIPPLDGGRILVGLLPKTLARPIARLEPYGIAILVALLFVLPLFGAELGLSFNLISRAFGRAVNWTIGEVVSWTGNNQP